MPLHIETPLQKSVPLSQLQKKEIHLKLEVVQNSGSFKIRGIGNLCETLVKEQKVDHLISSSGGNAGYAAAYAASNLNVKATIVVPNTTPEMIKEKMKQLNAEVITHGNVWDEANEMAVELTKEKNTGYIPPFDHPLIWKGNSTVILEAKKQLEHPPDAILTVVGGGGLLCGICEGLQEVGWDTIPVIACETEGAASFKASAEKGELVKFPITSIAKTLGASTVAAKALEWSKKREIINCVVSDLEAVNACFSFANDHRYLIEPSCGAALAAIYSNKPEIQKYSSILVIVCGGNIVTIDQLFQWKEQLEQK